MLDAGKRESTPSFNCVVLNTNQNNFRCKNNKINYNKNTKRIRNQLEKNTIGTSDGHGMISHICTVDIVFVDTFGFYCTRSYTAATVPIISLVHHISAGQNLQPYKPKSSPLHHHPAQLILYVGQILLYHFTKHHLVFISSNDITPENLWFIMMLF